MHSLVIETKDQFPESFKQSILTIASNFSISEILGPNSANDWEWHLTFAGSMMQHNYYLYHIIDLIMIGNRHIDGIIEIGTGHGALTTVLGLWGISRHIPVITVDHQHIHNERIFSKLGITYYMLDEFDETLKSIITDFINSRGPILFICDGGNKIREFNLWSNLLKPSSIIAVHDWTREINYTDISEESLSHCSPYAQELWNMKNVQFAMFKVN